MLACLVMGDIRYPFFYVEVKGVVKDFVVTSCFYFCEGALYRDGSTILAKGRVGLFAQYVMVHADRSALRIHTAT